MIDVSMLSAILADNDTTQSWLMQLDWKFLLSLATFAGGGFFFGGKILESIHVLKQQNHFTREDIKSLKEDIKSLREEFKGDIKSLREELKGDIKQSEIRLENSIKQQLGILTKAS